MGGRPAPRRGRSAAPSSDGAQLAGFPSPGFTSAGLASDGLASAGLASAGLASDGLACAASARTTPRRRSSAALSRLSSLGSGGT
ncbi:MAG: hypothetical protein HZY79_05560 [Rhodoblastus sp.]|nr:MAG: hypothetical protein HZY79_05560 [Rhodoblastus sp.]